MIIIAHIVLAVRCVIYMLATTITNGAYLAAASQPLHGKAITIQSHIYIILHPLPK